MAWKMAVKKLTDSDLTFFRSYFYSGKSSAKQKAINLNANVFRDTFYPDIDEFMEEYNDAIPVDLHIYGPGITPEHRVARKIIKRRAYKNFRLDGELVPDPEEAQARYSSLMPGDLAIFAFEGAGRPTEVTLVLVSQNVPEDRGIYDALQQYLGAAVGGRSDRTRKSMVEISEEELLSLLQSASPQPADEHPIWLLVLSSLPEIEEAVWGEPEAERKLLRRIRRNAQGMEAIQRMERARKRTGLLGESLINAYFERLMEEGKIRSFEWVSSTLPLYPYDFEVTYPDGVRALVEVKTTTGDFQNSMRFSCNEILQMAEGETYHVYRVSSIRQTPSGTEAQLRIATDVRDLAHQILNSLEKLPPGVTVTHVAIRGEAMNFGDPIPLFFPTEEEQGGSFQD